MPQRSRRAIDAGHLGLIRSDDVEFLSSGLFFGASVERPEFVANPALSGGELMNVMVYPVDYLHYLTGARVTAVFAEAGTFFSTRSGNSASKMSVSFPCGWNTI